MPNKLVDMSIKHYLCTMKLRISNLNNEEMELKRLTTATLSDALTAMSLNSASTSPRKYALA